MQRNDGMESTSHFIDSSKDSEEAKDFEIIEPPN